MKSQSFTVTQTPEQNQLEKVLEQIDPKTLTPEARADAMIHAGIDKYVGGVGFFRLKSAWRTGVAGDLVVRHVNSGGVQVTICTPDELGAAPIASTSTPAGPSEAEQKAAADAAAAAAAELELQRQAQQLKDAETKAENSNQENTPAPADGAAPTP